MPAPRLKREISGPQKDISRSEDQLIPALLTSVVGEVCAAMHASGAMIAGPDAQGIRCVASAGNAPAAGSRLEPNIGLTAECLRTGKVVFREHAKRRALGSVSTEARPAVHSAVAVPILAEGVTVGVIEVFSLRPSAIYKADIAPLEGIADFLAPILAPASVYEVKPAAAGSALTEVQTKTRSGAEEKPIAPYHTAHPGDSLPLAIEQKPAPSVEAAKAPQLGDKVASTRAWLIGAVRLVLQRFARTTAAARAWTASHSATVVGHLAQSRIAKRSLAGIAIVLAATLLFVEFHARFVRTPRVATQPASGETRPAGPAQTAKNNPPRTIEIQGGKVLSYSSPSAAPPAARSQSSSNSETAAAHPNVASADPTVPAEPQEVGIETVARPASLPPESRPLGAAENQPSGGPASLAPMAAEANVESFELPTGSGKLPVLAVTPAVPAAIEAAIISRPTFVLDRTFKGHSSWVTSIAFSPDGRRLASGSWDQTVKFWDVPTGHELDTLGHKMKEVQALALSRDGHWLAAENSSDTVTLWDATTGTEVRTLPSNKPLGPLGSNWVYSIAFSPDGRWLASGVDEKTVRLWDVHTGRAVRDLTTTRRSVIYAAFSPDGRWLASGDDDKSIRIWEASTGEEIRRLTGHRKLIYAVAFSPNGRWLASASADKTVKIWDVADGREVHTLTGHGNMVTSLAFSPDGHWLASGSWDKTVRIWDVATGREVQTLGGGHDHSIYTVAFDSRGRWLASGSEDGSISLWRLGGVVDRSRLQ